MTRPTLDQIAAEVREHYEMCRSCPFDDCRSSARACPHNERHGHTTLAPVLMQHTSGVKQIAEDYQCDKLMRAARKLEREICGPSRRFKE